MKLQERVVTSGVADQIVGPRPEEARLRAWVERLAIPRHIEVNAQNNARVRDDLADGFRACGLDVRFQGPFQNVVGLPPNATGRPLTLIGAHYDSVPNCPGADDNASAVAAMLEAARVITARTPHLPVGFVGFNAEEDGLVGSRDFVSKGLTDLGLRVAVIHVLEMVGYRGEKALTRLPIPFALASLDQADFIGLLGNGRSNALIDRAMQQSVVPGLRVIGLKTWGPIEKVVVDMAMSDHHPFWAAGIPAVMWTDTAYFRNPHYHQRSDTPDTLDYRFMRDVTELLCAMLSAL